MKCYLLPLIDDDGNIIPNNVIDSLNLTRVLIDYHWNEWSAVDAVTKGDGSILQCAFAKDTTADQLTGYDSIDHSLSIIEKEDLAIFQLLGDISEKIVDGMNIGSDITFEGNIFLDDEVDTYEEMVRDFEPGPEPVAMDISLKDRAPKH